MVFKPGQSGNPAGRPVGARVKLAEDFIADLAAEWSARGTVALTELSPDKLVDAVLKLLPKDVNVTVKEPELSEAELYERVATLQSVLATASGLAAPSRTNGHAIRAPKPN